MRVGQNNVELPSRHEFMTATRKGALESGTVKGGNEVPATYGAEWGHQAIFVAPRSIPFIGGMEKPFVRPNTSQSSRALCSSALHASSFEALAYTPCSPG